ncbi:MAG: hypothetical protein ACR2QE_03020 [Acidimicrobiales bacterium]
MLVVFTVVILGSGCALLARTSTDGSGDPFTVDARNPELSGDGRYAVFESADPGIVAGDTNGKKDIFLRDHQSMSTEAISVNPSSVPGDGESFGADISADGRFVVFSSSSTDLVAGDTNGFYDVFVRDRQAGTTERVNSGIFGAETNGHSYAGSISDDGRYVAFYSSASNVVFIDNNNSSDVFVVDRTTGLPTLVSHEPVGFPANGGSYAPVISADGSTVVYQSDASNVVAGDTNAATDVFWWERVSDRNVLASVPDGGGVANGPSRTPDVSADGRHVTYQSQATNMAPTDTDSFYDVFRRDMVSAATVQASVTPSGAGAGGSSTYASISGDGARVAFRSSAGDIDPADSNGVLDVFVWQEDSVERVSVATDFLGGVIEGNGNSLQPSLSDDGSAVGFETAATNLLADDINGVTDIAVRAARTPRIEEVRGSLVAGKTRQLQLLGSDFPPDAYVSVQGDGVGATSVLSWTPTELLVEVGMLSTAPTGPRQVWVIDNLQALFGHPIGAGDHVEVDVGTDSVISDPPGGAADGVVADHFGLSADGRYSAFATSATNLVAGDTNGVDDVYRYDAQTGILDRASVTTAGAELAVPVRSATVSDDGRYVVFEALGQVGGDYYETVYVKDMVTGTLTAASGPWCSPSVVHGASPVISGDGAVVVFTRPWASGCTGGTDRGVFRWNRVSGVTETVSTDSSGADATWNHYSRPRVDADGDRVVYQLGNWVFLRDWDVAPGGAGWQTWVNETNSSYYISEPDIDAAGERVVYRAGPAGAPSQAFVYDHTNGSTVQVSHDGSGGNLPESADHPRISGDGQWFTFRSLAGLSGLAGFPGGDLYLADTQGVQLEIVADGQFAPEIGATLDCILYRAYGGDLRLFDRDGSCSD